MDAQLLMEEPRHRVVMGSVAQGLCPSPKAIWPLRTRSPEISAQSAKMEGMQKITHGRITMSGISRGRAFESQGPLRMRRRLLARVDQDVSGQQRGNDIWRQVGRSKLPDEDFIEDGAAYLGPTENRSH